MFRLPLFMFGTLLTLVGVAQAATETPYVLDASATREAGKIVVAVTISRHDSEGKLEKLSAPRISLNEGQCGYITVAGAGMKENPDPHVAKDTHDPAEGDNKAGRNATAQDVEISGVWVEVVTIKGSDKTIVVGKFMVKDSVVWAETKSVDIVVAQKDDAATSPVKGEIK